MVCYNGVMMNFEEHARTYSDFFSQYDITTKISVDDDPLHMHQVQAVGHVDDLGKLIEKCTTMSGDELHFESDKYFNNSFVGEAFFYFAMTGLLKGKKMKKIADEFMVR